MKYQETGRFGRITKALRNNGFEQEMKKILFDSNKFPTLKKTEQTKYVETVMSRMEQLIGVVNTKKIMSDCGKLCCGKSWTAFARKIYNDSGSMFDFFKNLNKEEKKYNTFISFNEKEKTIRVQRTKCICGLINKGSIFLKNNTFCSCSNGHMLAFFGAIFSVEEIILLESIYSGDKNCTWRIKLK